MLEVSEVESPDEVLLELVELLQLSEVLASSVSVAVGAAAATIVL